MALIACPECDAQVSDQAATCPQCGVRFARKRGKRHVWVWWTLAAVAIVAGAIVGVFVWSAEQARAHMLAAQDEAWTAEVVRVGAMHSPSEAGSDGSYFVIASKPGGTCTGSENEAMYQDYVTLTEYALGYKPSDEFMLLNGITRASAVVQCNDLKRQDFSRSVTSTLDKATKVLDRLGVSDASVAQLKSMRGLDGTQERVEEGTAVGSLRIVFQYDGLNGAQIRVERLS